jgi:pimeloyl-ACP methyl ester carboxylesterase
MYRHVIEPIARAGYHVIVPDYRGAGQSSISLDGKTGYDKFTMAKDIHSLYKDNLGIEKAYIVGIDIGSMVATALALQFREDVLALYASGESISVNGRLLIPI